MVVVGVAYLAWVRYTASENIKIERERRDLDF